MRSPSVKQRKYVAGLVAGKSKQKAAIDAGYAPSMGKNAGQKLDATLGVQRLFKELMEGAGVTDRLLAKRIHDGLNATVVSKETKFSRREVLVDFSERREMVELAIRMKGLMPAEEHKHSVTLEELLEESQG